MNGQIQNSIKTAFKYYNKEIFGKRTVCAVNWYPRHTHVPKKARVMKARKFGGLCLGALYFALGM